MKTFIKSPWIFNILSFTLLSLIIKCYSSNNNAYFTEKPIGNFINKTVIAYTYFDDDK